MSTTTLQPNCIASDGTSLYAHAAIYQYSVGSMSQTIVLAKSNASPASLVDLTWTVISTIPQTSLYYLLGLASIKSFACSISSQGVFTILSTTSKSFATDFAPPRPRGYQYDPANGGKWTNVDVTDNYKWNILSGSALFYVSGATGDPTLMHAYRTSNVVDTITFSVFDKSTNTFKEQNNTWALPATSGTPYGFAAGGNNLYVLSNKILANSFLNIAPVYPTGSPPAASSVKTLAANIAASCPVYTGALNSVVAGSTYYLFCSDSTSALNYLVTSDGNSIGPAIKTNTSIRTPESFFPLGAAGGAPTWAFMTNNTNMFGVTLTGADVGVWQQVPYKLNVTGLGGSSPGVGSGSGSGSGPTFGSGSSSGGLSTITLIAIIAGAVVVILISGAFIWTRRRARRVKALVVDAPYTLQPAAWQPYGPSHHEMGTFLPPPPQAYSDSQLLLHPPEPPQTPQQYSPAKDPYYYPQHEQQPTTLLPQQLQHTQQHKNPQQHAVANAVGQPQSGMDSQAIWSPIPSDTSTLISNSPQYLNAYSQDPQAYTTPSYPTPVLAIGGALEARHPQVYAPPGAPQSWGDETVAVFPTNYRRAPQDRMQDQGSEHYH